MTLVSAIIPTYNRAALLARALASVAAQDYRPIEAIVIDDGSTDNTPAVLEEQRLRLADQGVSLVCHKQQNGRAPKARNTGMKLAKGEVFAFLDSDDLWRPGYVSAVMRLLERYPSAGLAFSGIVAVDAHDNVTKERESRLPPEPREALLAKPFELIMRYMPMQTSGVMVRRSVVADVGDFDLYLPVVEDWDLWYRIGKKYDFAYTLEGLACNREHGDNLPKFSIMALGSGLRMNLKHLPDVTDPATREILVARIRKQILLLQEELLREGQASNGFSSLLSHELAPRSMRFRVGSALGHGPRWMGKAYAGAVRWLGKVQRGE